MQFLNRSGLLCQNKNCMSVFGSPTNSVGVFGIDTPAICWTSRIKPCSPQTLSSAHHVVLTTSKSISIRGANRAPNSPIGCVRRKNAPTCGANSPISSYVVQYLVRGAQPTPSVLGADWARRTKPHTLPRQIPTGGPILSRTSKCYLNLHLVPTFISNSRPYFHMLATSPYLFFSR